MADEEASRWRSGTTANKLTSVCPYILGNEFCERLAYYGLTTNLSIYLTTIMGLSNGHASVQVSLFSGTAYITPLIGAWVADGYWGRFTTIMAFSTVYAVGMFGMAATALYPGLSPQNGAPASVLQLGLFFTCLYTVALGTGGIKPNVSAFGADQFDDSNPVEKKQKESFFNYFYFAVNVGALISSTVIVWIQEWSWGIGFALPAFFMALAVVFFYAGKGAYVYGTAVGSPFGRVIGLSIAVLQLRVQALCGGSPQERDNVRINDDEVPLLAQERQSADMLQRAGWRLGMRPEQVEEVRLIHRLGPILLLSILYNTMYSQMSTVFVLQAQHMDRRVYIGNTDKPFVLPAASISTFDVVAVIALVPVYDGILRPFLQRIGRDMSVLQRIGWGFLVIAAAMGWAGHVETQRMAALARGSNISALLQATQYSLVGASEVLASIGIMEFFYEQAPDAMRSCGLALSSLGTSLGGYLSAGILGLVSQYTSWLDNLDGGSRLDLYFYFLTTIMLFNTVVFAVVTMDWKYKQPKTAQPSAEGLLSPHIPNGGNSSAPPIDIATPHVLLGQPLPGPAANGDEARSFTVRPHTPAYPQNYR